MKTNGFREFGGRTLFNIFFISRTNIVVSPEEELFASETGLNGIESLGWVALDHCIAGRR